MAYQGPTIDSTGMHIPSYDDLIEALTQDYINTFGAGSYIDMDSADYEWMSILAKYLYDAFLLNQLNYTNRSPATVIGGEPQDILYIINGVRRKLASYSRCVVILTGEPNTTIINGVVRDVGGNLWNLTSPTIIGADGTISATATSQEPGRIIALPGDIRFINTPQAGWTSVNNEEQAITGSAVETDAEFRERRLFSVANPSRSIMEGIIGGVAAVSGVTRFKGYENDTNLTDSNGLPPHSICMVVEGGDRTAIATAIYLHKTPGCDTYGDQHVTIYDQYLNPNVRSFFYAGYQEIDIHVVVRKLANYTAQDATNITNKIKEYMDGLAINQAVIPSVLASQALSANISIANPTFVIDQVQIAIKGNPLALDTIDTPFNMISTTELADIVIEEVE